ncbi:type 2 isopentenyl-diphosphate Delta-isomerase [Pseudomonas sp. gcc21]|uniref:type 2 isopentenyl-diphosphate Delta-isomerase n=1 Tax=Pseudomonas sp. gcc21 TaxID=2726989 RepID=UPI001451238C|nr:type 2 isopentenyl-diphosphate Delta-isomerase [Pseudomonas sp. gcc21]QJD58911.1 type 2 isopentenyl-diphosphate Delta-isomerase [Pseudomonas sp. gcc21]
MAHGELVDRKNDHLDIVLDPGRAISPVENPFSAFRLEHCALPELDLDAIDLSREFLGRTLRAPVLISSMTGGAKRAKGINLHLAEAAEQLGIALAIGSQRVAVQTGVDHGLTRELRARAPSVPLLSNIGAAQLAEPQGIDWARQAVQMIDADALIVHLNPLQEAVQGGGDRNWIGVLASLRRLVREIDVPVVVKEVGAGISARVATSLADAGVAVIDIAGAGGTSWAAVESERATNEADRRVAQAFASWGIPTPYAILGARQVLPRSTLIASGGIRDGVDAAKAIRLGADLVGQAAAVLHGATQSTDAVVAHFQILIRQLRIACFCTGSANLAALRQAPIFRDATLLEPWT